jgi:tetratricopeptide (TPR) repeat protein
MSRDRVPLDWAMTQNNLGTALRALGQRESETSQLKEAVAAYRAALEERRRDRVPLQWATTQNNLGNALQALGQRESGTARLQEAIRSWDACLTVASSAWLPEWVQTERSNRHETQAEISRRAAK